MSIQTLVRVEATGEVFDFLQVGEEYRIDSRAVAPGLGIEHKHFLETLRTYQTELEHFGVMPFETAKPPKGSSGGRPETYVMLNRNQVLFAITLSRNTEQVVMWKMALIDALSQLEQQLQATSRPLQIGMGKARRGGVQQKVFTLDEIDKRIVAGVRLYKHRYGRPPSCSDVKKFYLRRVTTKEQVQARIEQLIADGTLKEIQNSHATFYTLTDL